MKKFRKIVISLIGFLLIILGILLLFLPGPGILLIAAGFLVLGLEFEWANRFSKKVFNFLKSRKKK